MTRLSQQYSHYNPYGDTPADGVSDWAATENMIPLVCIGFMLVTFFLISLMAGGVPSLSAFRGLQPPLSEIAGEIISVRILSGGAVQVDGAPSDLSVIRTNIIERRFRKPKANVVLFVEEGARASLIARVMDECKLAGADDVRLVISQEGSSHGI